VGFARRDRGFEPIIKVALGCHFLGMGQILGPQATRQKPQGPSSLAIPVR
jgi:hypothetical protein